MTRLEELARKVDAFFARVAVRHATDMQCATGCSDCCHVRLTVTAVEAEAIRAHVTTWPAEQRRNLADTGPAHRCAALDPAGRCKIYEVRPLVCRSHGVPIRMRQGGLPVVQACHRNFTHTAPDPDCVLDQETLSAMLLAVNAAEAGAAAPRPARSDAAEPGSGTETAPAGLPAADGTAAGTAVARTDLARLLADLAAI